ncbi:MAG: glycosyltransferase family 4 protein [Planctomycetota bacterium]
MADLERVLFLTENIENNGPVYNCLSLARAYRKKNIQTMTVSLSGGGRESSFMAADLNLLISSHVAGLFRGGNDRKIIRDFNPSIIHALDFNMFNTAEKLSNLLKIPFVFTQNRCIEKDISNKIKSYDIVAVSDAVQMSLIKNGRINRSQITVIHNGIDLNRYTLPQKKSANNQIVSDYTKNKTQVVGSLGSLLPEKGQRLLLKAAKIVLDKFTDIEFVIIGQGPDLNLLRKLAAEMGISNRITFTSGLNFVTNSTGSADSKQEAVFLRDFDIFVEPSTNEGLGLSAMQAMAWARPVVAFGAGGLYSLIEDGLNGYLVPKENEEAMADAISNLLTDPAKADRMGTHGRELIENNFNINSIADKHISFYKNIITKSTI